MLSENSLPSLKEPSSFFLHVELLYMGFNTASAAASSPKGVSFSNSIYKGGSASAFL